MFISPVQEARSEDSRTRWVLDLNDRVFERWAHQSLVAHERFDSRILPSHRWWGFAQRWTYFFSRHWQGLIELSYQDALSDSGPGTGSGSSTPEVFEALRRGALGIAWAPQDHIWSRPQLRVLYQKQDRQDQIGSTSEERFGYQFELWF
jgi:maltoporin